MKHVAKERVTEWGTIVSSLSPSLICVRFVLVPLPPPPAAAGWGWCVVKGRMAVFLSIRTY